MPTKLQPAVVNFENAPHSVELREISKPGPLTDDEVRVDVQAVGVCGSDLHMWTGDQSWEVRYPLVLGHEFAGIISEVGTRETDFQVGDRVVCETHARIDVHNPMTRQGLYNLDPNRQGFGAVIDGAMTHQVNVPTRIVHRIPDNLNFETAAMTEPCCVAFNAVVNNGGIRPADRILVLGPGPIGILSAAIARICGAEVGLLGLPRDQTRLNTARHYGCTVMTSPDDARSWAMDFDGMGVDGIVDATGVSNALELALQLVRPAGWISKVGWGPQPMGFSLDALVQKNVRLQGSFSHYWSIWERIIRLLSTQQLDVAPIIGGRWGLDAWKPAFETMHAGDIVKAVLIPPEH